MHKYRNDICTASVTVLTILCLSSLSFASEPDKSAHIVSDNIFNADLSHPVIAKAVTEFENVCLPFIVHETELTPEQDREVFKSSMVEAGYVFEGEKKWQQISPLEKFQHTSLSCPYVLPDPEKDGKYTIYRGLENSLSNSKQFTVYNGTISEPISSTGTYVGKTCEILPRSLTPVRYTNYTRQNFIKLDYFPVVTNLTWQDIPDDYLKVLSHAHASRFGVPKTIKLKTTFLPASSCQINVAGVNLSLSTVTNAIISHDKDWSTLENIIEHSSRQLREDSQYWRQCSSQDDEHFIYTLALHNSSLSVKVESLQGDKFSADYKCQDASRVNFEN